MKLPKLALAVFLASSAASSGVTAFAPAQTINSRQYNRAGAVSNTANVQRTSRAFASPLGGSADEFSSAAFQAKRKRPRSPHAAAARAAFRSQTSAPASSSKSTALRASIEEDIEIVSTSSSDLEAASSDAAATLAAAAATSTAALSRDEARSSASSYLSQYTGESAASIIYSKLVENDVTVVNGYSGGAVLPLLDQFHGEHPRHGTDENGNARKIRWITNSNESSAGHIGEGFAKSAPGWKDGKMQAGVVVATSGPGVTNLITPLTDAMCDGVPLVVLCGQAATFAPEAAFQSCPAVDLTRPVTKWSYQITSAAEVPFVMDYAFYVARNGRPGPVFIDLPKDLQNQVITDDLIKEFTAGLADVSTTEGGGQYVAPTASKTATFDAPFVGLSTHTRPNGEGHCALHLGDATQGLAFDVSTSDLTLRPTLSARSGADESYELDIHPSNTIHATKIETDGSTTTTVGNLAPGTEVLTEMLDLIRQARKPVIIAGQGCNDAPDELLAFAEALQIPVTTTLHAMGVFDERHPLALNMLGMHGHATPNFMVQECDLLINIGSRFDDRITGALGSFLPEARRAAVEGRGGVIHVDIRKSEHAKQVEPNFFVHSTGVDFLRAVNEELGLGGSAEIKPATTTRSWLKYKAELEKEYPVPVPEYRPETIKVQSDDGSEHEETRTKMSSQYVIKKMNEVILAAGRMDDCFFSTGVGIHQMVAAQHITWTKPRQMLSSGSLGTMGVCLGYTIGAKLANPQAICIGIDGDGSFNMTFTELKTVAEQGIPIKMIILDNESQMMVEYWQRLFHGERYLAVRNTNPDYVKLAESFRIKSVYCDHAEDLEAKLREFLFEDPDEPVLFHCRVERTPCMPMVAPGKALDDMIHRDEAFEVDPTAAPS